MKSVAIDKGYGIDQITRVEGPKPRYTAAMITLRLVNPLASIFAGSANGNPNNQTTLKPGLQAITAGRVQPAKIFEANMAQTVAWNGLFDFNGLGVKEVMNQLPRWYDIDVRYEGKGAGFTFVGEICRSEKLSVILKTLE